REPGNRRDDRGRTSVPLSLFLFPLFLIVIWACGDPVSPPAPVVASVIIDPILAIVAPGESVTVASRALTADLRTVPNAIEWTTSDPAVATVASNGTVTAKGNGTASIKA